MTRADDEELATINEGASDLETVSLPPNTARVAPMPRPRFAAHLAFLCLCASAASCFPAEAQTRPLRILFIGNSLTAWNDLPDVVGRLAMADGQSQPLTRTIAIGGFSLEDHWK